MHKHHKSFPIHSMCLIAQCILEMQQYIKAVIHINTKLSCIDISSIAMIISQGWIQEGQCPPSKIFYLHVNATINSMKISFNDVLSLLNLKNYNIMCITYRIPVMCVCMWTLMKSHKPHQTCLF